VAQFINRDKYNEWLAPRIASRFRRKFNITHKVTDEGGNGAVEEAKALVTVHTELENTVADLINDRGIKNVQMRDYASNSNTTEKHVKFGKSESTQIQVALNGNIALDIGVVKLSMGLSFTSSSTLTVDHSEEVILEPGMHAGAFFYELQKWYDVFAEAYGTDGYNGGRCAAFDFSYIYTFTVCVEEIGDAFVPPVESTSPPPSCHDEIAYFEACSVVAGV
jgi:hypothetical protein